ncbi:hypothetical protein PANI_CDS0009 [Maribacter phage Panino]
MSLLTNLPVNGCKANHYSLRIPIGYTVSIPP